MYAYRKGSNGWQGDTTGMCNNLINRAKIIFFFEWEKNPQPLAAG